MTQWEIKHLGYGYSIRSMRMLTPAYITAEDAVHGTHLLATNTETPWVIEKQSGEQCR